MNPTRVLLANEPRAYRDTIAVALRMLRPDADVIVAEPDVLDAAIVRHDPQMVVCSRLTETVEIRVPTWLVLYPEGERSALRYLHGERATVSDIELAEIAHLLDETCRTAQA